VKPLVQGLVYIFIALAGLGVGAAAYFGLTFTPIEAGVTAVAVGCIAVMLMERSLRRRSEARLENAIEDLSRLLAADAQAGAVLSQRINALTDADAGMRLEAIEADVSVLGTIVRQVAEAVAEIEEARRSGPFGNIPSEPDIQEVPSEPDPDQLPEPIIPLHMLRQALDEGRLICHIEPIIALPQRRPNGYDIVPRLMLEDGELADRAEFLPRQGGGDVIQRIENMAFEEAIVIARRARTAGQPILLYVPISRASLADPASIYQLVATLDANRAVAGALTFSIVAADWRRLDAEERTALAAMVRLGAGLALVEAATLRFDYADLGGAGVRSIRVDATRFLDKPESFTDFHASDIAAYTRRNGVELMATGVLNEQQVLTLFEDGILQVQGPYIAGPGPVRPDLMIERGAPLHLGRVAPPVEAPRRA